ncbi:DEAD/DEAH box helicase [Pseudohalioglobus lutimaris]|uniref:ATP-dependent RNA helicase RhlE n=1 Tax=Pseudohalioglobus lutimaris TaxID=1737061 RepID=A0A2N5X5H9_9GAMM|nr:DEAD/DEAH box helicase [Pseudohalioglobus lutimaris]PLW69721.1 ATP-dependent RNA helicase RhlE [Pseudohalioglobus lutimaris]
MTFEQLGLSPALLLAVQEKGYTEPSPVQEQAIPAVLSGRDVMAAAQTGTGKTAGFTLPILQRLLDSGPLKPHRTRALILAPTRELAAQVAESVGTYGAHLPLKSAVVFGGVKINPQIERLRRGVDILIATPGRLLDLHGQGEINFDDLEILVLDEADRMLDMGFIHDIRRIIKLLPSERQNLLFSATFAMEIRELTTRLLHNPVEVEVAAANATADNVEQWVYPVDKKRKSALLRELVEVNNWTQVLVFARTKHGANRLAQQLEKAGLEAAAIHGNKSQSARTRALEGFKNGSVRVLVATDIAARGLDIAQLPQVVNFDLPNVPEDYVHRIGRTGRAGASGRAYSLVSADEIKQLNAIEQVIQRHLKREYISGFEPDHEVPASAPLRKPKQAGRPGGGKGRGGGKHTARGRGSDGHNRPRRRRRPRAGSPARKPSS